MLPEQTMEKLYAMKLNGVADAWEEQRQQPHSSDLSFDDRLAILVERQWIWKENRALATRLQYAHLKQTACLEDIDFRHPRGLKRAAIDQLASCEWIRHRRPCLITGPTGLGKSDLACDLAHKACQEGFRALYYYGPKLFRELNQAQADGSLTRLLKKLARVDLLAVDDWGLTPLQPDQYRLFLEILDDRTGATLLTSQYPINTWHELVGDPTVGDAILDRLVHNAYKIELDGDSLRKKKAKAK
jgi:DNA replication protein DnaC